MFIILNTTKIFDKRIDHIKYRNNVVTGKIATVNGNDTYDCYISGSDTAYPNIPTTAREPDFEVGEAVEILIEYGNKEMPIIIGHAKKIAQEFVEDKINVLVTTLDAYSITETTAYLELRIEEVEGYENCTRYGFYYGTSTDYGSDVYSTGSFVAGCYNKSVTDLGAGTTYHYQAYVLDADSDEHTGEDKTMTTTAAIKNIYVVYKKTSDSKYYLVKINSDDSITAIAELTELYGTKYSLVRILTDNNGNVYALKQKENGTNVYTWYKYNSSGILQTSKVVASNEMFGFIYNGYLYTMIFNGDELHKRNLSDLEIAETISLTSSHRYYYLCFDGSGYLFTYDRDYSGGAAIIKWEIGVGVSDSHTQGIASLSAWADWSLLGDFIACDYSPWAGAIYSFNTNLDSDAAGWALDDIPTGQACGIASTQIYMYILGENTADDKLIIEKYNSSKVLQTTIDISNDYIGGGYRRYHNAITAYPF